MIELLLMADSVGDSGECRADAGFYEGVKIKSLRQLYFMALNLSSSVFF